MPDPITISIAVIDDDDSFNRSMERLLRAARYQPVTYRSAEAFLSDTTCPHFDCLLVDVELGGMTGLELKRRLTKLGWTTPVIYVTAHDDLRTRMEASADGCFAFVSKVDSSDALLKAIAAAVSPGSEIEN